MNKVNKVIIVAKKVEYISVEVSEENGYTLPDGSDMMDTFNFLDGVKSNFEDYLDDELATVTPVSITLETFKVI